VTLVTVPEPVTGLACSVIAEPGLKISPAVGLVIETIGAAVFGGGEGVGVGVGLGVGVGDEVGLGAGVGVGVGVGLAPSQVVPFSVNVVGAALLPL